MTSISKDFIESDLRSNDVIEALKSGNHDVIDQVASKIYSKMLSFGKSRLDDDPDWAKKEEQLKWVLHVFVAVFGEILSMEELSEQVKGSNYEDHRLVADLGYELKFRLLDLLGLYYDVHYPPWNLVDVFTPDYVNEKQLLGFLKPTLQPPSAPDLVAAQQANTTRAVLDQVLTNWRYWCEVYKSLVFSIYDANEDDTIVGFHSLFAVSAHLISASHIGSLILFSWARAVKDLHDETD